MLRLELVDGRVCPLVFCDFCGHRIDGEGNFGTGYFPDGHTIYGGRPSFTHKGCCEAFEERHDSELLWGWDEIEWLPVYLGQNLHIDWIKAGEAAASVGHYFQGLGPVSHTATPRKRKGERPERVQVSLKLRFEIFQRDGYRCRLCGRSAEDGIQLHVDHKHPVIKGGTNEETNLWTLCLECNLGKRTKDL